MSLSKLPRLGRAQGLPRLFGGRSQRLQSVMDPPAAPKPTYEDDYERYLANHVGDAQLAKRIIKWQNRYPYGTVIEAIVYDFLQRRGPWFEYQAEAFGGQRMRGGMVVDFIVSVGGNMVSAWRIMGQYFHMMPQNRKRDQAQRFLLLGTYITNRRVSSVIDVWEHDLLHRTRRDEVLSAALTEREISRPN